jgi:hypothetical protein
MQSEQQGDVRQRCRRHKRDGAFARAIAVAPSSVFVGGTFTTAGGSSHRALARVDRRTNAVLPWDAHVRSSYQFPVEALALDGDTLYVGGAFEQIGGRRRSCIAALNTESASARTWAPRLQVIDKDFLSASDDCSLNAVAINGPDVFLGGEFSLVGRRPHIALAAVDRRTAAPRAWLPSTGCEERYEPGFPGVNALAIAENVVHVGGYFNPTGCESGGVGLMLFPLRNVSG